ncbi:unnamed protein product [Amaranthus hypochondriacus]
MILGFGGPPSPFPSSRNSDNWFPPLNPALLFSNSVSHHRYPRLSLFLCTSLKGALKRQGRHLKQLNFFQSLNDVIVTSTAYTSCFCFLNGKSSGQDKGDEASSPQGASRNNFFLRGRCTSTLLVVNVLLYVAQVATQGRLMLWGAKVNRLIDEGQLWRLVTSAFLHANVGHLLVNCYSLNSVGPSVENICGTRRFFTIYFASAVASSAMSYWLSKAPAVGASGAIFGLVGSVAVFSMRHRRLLGSGGPDLKHIAQVIALNMIIGLASSGIDNWGHLGGLLGGAAVSWLVGPAWTYDYTTKDGRKVFVDKAPIYLFNRKNTR